MKGALMSVSDKLLLRKRAIIETVNDELKNLFDDISEDLFLQIDKLLEEYLDDEELCLYHRRESI